MNVASAASPIDRETGRAAAALASRTAIVLDLDGTLIDTLPDLVRTLNAALADFGAAPVPATLVRTTLHGGLEASAAAAAALAGLDAAPLAARYAEHYARAPDRLALAYPGVDAMLEHLVRRGHRLAVCTNKRSTEAERLLAKVGLLAQVPVLVGADSCEHRKPHPLPLRTALLRLGLAPTDGILVGDSLVDVETARAAGVPCVIHAGGYGDVPPATPGVVGRFVRWASLRDAPIA
ncbi:MAG: hypothetical protein RJA99_2894 [Pseudomonadota bacterium]